MVAFFASSSKMSSPASSSRRSSSRRRSSAMEPPSSDLGARPLPQSPASTSSRQQGPPALAANGPGSVLVSEIDLSSPLNYGTPSSMGSSHLRTPRSTNVTRTPGGGTPIRIRSDIQSERRLRQVVDVTPSRRTAPSSDAAQMMRTVTANNEVVPPSESSDSAAPHLVIWGTDVSVQVCKQKFKKFLSTFVEENVEEDERMDGFDRLRPLYLQRLAEVISLVYIYLLHSLKFYFDESGTS